MKVAGIVTEYNPFHKGHLYHINKTKDLTNCDGLVAIMSGNFVQRGLPAIMDKWWRANLALKNGVDLVLELPSVYSLSSAEFFAFGAVSLLHNSNVIDYISFGSECGDLKILMKIASYLVNEPEDYKKLLKSYLSQGLTFPTARCLALKEVTNISKEQNLDQILNSSNNILAVEYCKSLLKLKSTIIPVTVAREGSSYNSKSLSSSFSSATAIRKHIKDKRNIDLLENHLPNTTYTEFKKLINSDFKFPFVDDIFLFVKYRYFTNKNAIHRLPDVSEGLENRIYESIKKANNYDQLISLIKSKRYTYTRISRILCQYFIGFENYNIKSMRTVPCPYIRVLGFNGKGTEILKRMKKNSSIPIITKLKGELSPMLQLDIQSTNAYSLINKDILPYSDYLKSPVRYI